MVDRLTEKPKPIEDGFPYDVETDSLADSLGLRLPNRSLILLAGEVGSGKSLVSQRFVHSFQYRCQFHSTNASMGGLHGQRF